MLVVANDIVEAAIRVNFALHGDAFFDFFKALLDNTDAVSVFDTFLSGTWLISLPMRH